MKQNQENNLALFLKELRSRDHYTQAYVAKKLGISRQGYNHYELGTASPDLSSLSILSQLYDIPLEAFLNIENRNNSYLKENAPPYSLYKDLQHSIHYSDAFLHYYTDPEHQKKYQHLNRTEKEMLFYFQQLRSEEQQDILLFIYIKFLKTNY